MGALDVWAVGTLGTILHYDGCWRVETSPTTATLNDVWAAPGGVAWAVGAGGITVRRDAGVWAIVPAPTTEVLNGVWGASATDVWAVTAGFQAGGAILHWNGTAWSVSFQTTLGDLLGISGTSTNDVSVVGRGHDAIGDYASLVLRWDGTAWTESYACNPPGTRFAGGGFVSYLQDVWSVAGGSVWAVGACFSPTIASGLITRGAGTTWGFGGIALPLLSRRPLSAVWASADTNVWAAASGSAPIHFDGTDWTESPDPNTNGILDLGGSGATDVWAVGYGGKRLHFDGTAWTLSP